MDRSGDLVNPSDIARFSDDEAVSLLRELLRKLGEHHKVVLSEACGSAPGGSIPQVVTERLGEGVFSAWLEAFRSRDGNRCAAILEAASADGTQ